MKRFLLLKTIVLSMLCFSCSDDDVNQQTPTSLERKINQYLENQSTNQPGLSIAVRKDDEVVYTGHEGIARKDTSLPIDSETQFRIASISKPITALAIMQLVASGKLNLEDKLLSFYPDLPESFGNITIAHLLSHRSGLLDYIDDNNNLEALNNLNMQDALTFLSAPNSGFENLVFEPGTSGRYSNTGYVLLALIVEKVTSSSFPDYLNQNIFEPAGMKHSFVISENEHLGDHGGNYALSYGTNIKVKGFNSLIYGANGVVSTTSDMMKFVEALLSYELVDQHTLDQMTDTQGSIPAIESDYGLGWLTGTGNYWHTGRITSPNDFWHSGGFGGYQTVLLINPDLKLEVIILSNGGDDTKEKMWDILELTREHFLTQS